MDTPMTNPQDEPERRGPKEMEKRGPRRSEQQLAALRKVLAEGYDAGASIRALAAEHEVSYGFVREHLLKAEVELRTTRGTRPAAAKKTGQR